MKIIIRKGKIGTTIHKQLVGNDDYINDNIILNIDDDNTVNLFIFNEVTEFPKIELFNNKRNEE